jgi:4-hydroxythreonine-4-phosphate dehydrogenase
VRIALTSGEPAGIGPELCAAVAFRTSSPLVVLGDRSLIEARAAAAGIRLTLPAYDAGNPAQGPSLLHVPLACDSRPGALDARNSAYVLALLDRAAAGCERGEFSAMVTAPVHKGVICEAGFPFTGHTEYLAARFGVERVVMMLVGGGMRVALATTHVALRDVADAITRDTLRDTLHILHRALVGMFGVARPRILVAGLNPHAGEGGHLGREEIDVIQPVLEALRAEGFLLDGPLPADTLFQPARLADADAVLAMYHDQGLPVLKFASFGAGVNVTLGLPIVRTSVDHGTALDLAGTGRADCGSLEAAIELAAALAAGRAPVSA